MWLMDHQMNMRVSEEFGEYYRRLPLKKSPTIRQGNALRIDWQSLIDPLPFEKGPQIFNYILGNPPFIGYAWQNISQKGDLALVFTGIKGAGVLDYVSCWYLKAAQYLERHSVQDFRIHCAFVSTNSITQGEQVGILWKELVNRYKIKLHFAHRTFNWSNEARGNAAVHVVIIGFSNFDTNPKLLFEYEDIKGEPLLSVVTNINPYLVPAKDLFIQKRTKPICLVPEMVKGSSPTDGGHLLLDVDQKKELLKEKPAAKSFLRKYVGSYEFINNEDRWCLWLKEIEPSELNSIPYILNRLKEVRTFRLASKKAATIRWAELPALFVEDRQPQSEYLLIPRVSSENRKYIPIGFLQPKIIVSDSAIALPNATLYHFGLLTSLMHMTWVKYTCGRLKSDYRYSNSLVYNNYPWPESLTDKQKQAVEKAAQKVLDVRTEFPNSSLADLYDPLSMPPALVKAHQELDKAVDLCYRPQPFPNETKRIEFLFELYDKYTSGLFVKEKKSNKKKVTNT